MLLAVRSKGKCEYCDKNLFESIDNYKLWQVDHIIPKSAIIENFDPENFNNKSISC
ncbi:HNH endonuclease [Empedobacter sp.]|uniref:HNH endonuclease n=1 Tax=Empedobacter sp. TaxID=1927715 RepID=UPI003917BC9D